MLRVAASGLPLPSLAAARARGVRGDFAGILGGTEARESPAPASGTHAAGGLLAIQGDAGDHPPPRRRRRPVEEAAEAGLGLLRRLQCGLLGAGGLSLGMLEDAAGEAERLAAESPEAKRLCGPIALRLRLELAKLSLATPAFAPRNTDA